jgi:HD-like signal output (HDOD) protein/CheY-like chemotaxis protein
MTRILAVDHEPPRSSALRGLLDSDQHGWDVVYARGANAGLIALEPADFSVVLADRVMPEMDGIAFLACVQEACPGAVRILVGRPDEAAAMQAANVAHQFLEKPCSSMDLIAAIERSLSLQEILAGAEIRDRMGRLGALPVMPDRFWRLQRLLVDPNAAVRDAAAIVESDLGMTAKVLQLVNSAFFGRPRRVTRVSHAVGILGLRLLRDLALAAEAFAVYEGACPSGFSPDRLQRHSLLVGAIARELVADHPLSDDIYIAGLLHEVGQLALATRLPDSWLRIQTRVAESATPIDVVERDALGISHTEIGAYLLGIWRLPLGVVEAVRYHHAPTEPGRSGFGWADVIHVADALADELLPESRETTGGSVLNRARLEALGMSERLPRWRDLAQRVFQEGTTT